MKKWAEAANVARQACFRVMDRKTLREPRGEDTDGLTDSASQCTLCLDTHVPTKTIHHCPNNKAWFKNILAEKKKAGLSGSRRPTGDFRCVVFSLN